MIQTDVNTIGKETVYLFGWKDKKDINFTIEIVQSEIKANRRKSFFLGQNQLNWFMINIEVPLYGNADTTITETGQIDLNTMHGFLPVNTDIKF